MFTRRSIVFNLTVTSLCMILSTPVRQGCASRAAGLARLPAEASVGFVSDGDTIILDDGEKVRYLGIDAPEIGHGGDPSECYAQKSRKANIAMVIGKKITLRYGIEKRDRYGRLLAWVFLPDGTCVNIEMVRSGNAWVYRNGEKDREMLPTLLKAQREAISNRRGIWGACTSRPSPVYCGNLKTYTFHRPGCPLGREISQRHKISFADRLDAFSEGFSPCRVCKPLSAHTLRHIPGCVIPGKVINIRAQPLFPHSVSQPPKPQKPSCTSRSSW